MPTNVTYAPRQTADGRWRFTVERRGLLDAIGFCAECPGHETEDEARDHFTDYLRQNATLRRVSPDPAVCAVEGCGQDAVSLALGVGAPIPLCEEHKSEAPALGAARATVAKWTDIPVCVCGKPATHRLSWPTPTLGPAAVLRCAECAANVETVATSRITLLKNRRGSPCAVPDCGREATHMISTSVGWPATLVCFDHASVEMLTAATRTAVL